VTNPIHQHAVAAHRAGLCVLPAATDGSKAPAVEWKPYTTTRPTLEQLDRWFTDPRRTGLGYVTGNVSGGLLMIELEARAVVDGLLDELHGRARSSGLDELFDRMESGYTETTPSGGIHWLVRCPDGVPGNLKLARRPGPPDPATGRPSIEVLAETRGEGGWTVAAPSGGRTHPTGRSWELKLGDITTIATFTRDEVDLILDLVRTLDQMPRPEARPPAAATTATDGGERPGDAYNAATTWAELLEPHGWRHLFDRGDEAFWCRPGKPTGISATTNYAGADRLVVFSSSTPFDTERSYDRFGAYAVLEHRGDLRAAARALRGDGYGGPRPGSAAGQAPTSLTEQPEPYTDLGNARRLVAHHGHDLRYAPQLGRWLTWDSRRWAEDLTGEAHRRAKTVVDTLPDEPATNPNALHKHWTRSQNAHALNSIITVAQTEPGVPVLLDQLDADPWSLNVANGTLDLRTGTLTPHHRAGLHTKMAPADWDPTARCPRWEEFLAQILPDPDLVAFVQRAVGYSLTGSVREQVLFFLHGAGANGKSTFLATVQAVVGDYGLQSSTDLLTQGGDEHPTAVADLLGRRFVATIETEDGARLAEALVKQLTGGDTIRARRMRKDYFEFQPTHKLWLAANHKPNIRGSDFAIWRRIRLIPFSVTITDEQRDPDLPGKLAAELPGILRWAVDGARAWHADGLGTPAAVTAATAAYRHDEDHVGRFVDECLELQPGDGGTARPWTLSAKALRELYEAWCAEAGDRPWSGKALGKVLGERGIERTKVRTSWWWVGVRESVGGEWADEPRPIDPPHAPHPRPIDPVNGARAYDQVTLSEMTRNVESAPHVPH